MDHAHDRNLPVAGRRRARKLAIWNAGVWAIGNGLASTTLVIYLAKELQAQRLGLGISLMVAAPQIAGLLRLGAPALMDRLGDRKRFCVATFLAGALLIARAAVGVYTQPTAIARLVARGAGFPLVPLSLAPVFGHDRALVMAGRRGGGADSRAFSGAARTVARGRAGGRGDCRRMVRPVPYW